LDWERQAGQAIGEQMSHHVKLKPRLNGHTCGSYSTRLGVTVKHVRESDASETENRQRSKTEIEITGESGINH